MTDFTWFRLVIRAIGVLLIGLAIPSVANYLASLIYAIADPSSAGIGVLVFHAVAELAGVLLKLGFGLYLLFGGTALIRYCTRDIAGLCPSCGYDVRALTSDRCPECGSPLPRRAQERADVTGPMP